MTRRFATAFILILVLQGAAAHAANLDADACGKLKGELAQLEQAGARASMAKGPEWAKANLVADKLEQVRRLIEVDEQLLFRCQGKPLVLLPVNIDADTPPKADDADDAKAPGEDAKKAPAAKAEAKKAPPEKKAALPPAEKKPAASKAAAQPVDKADGKPTQDAARPKKAAAAPTSEGAAKQGKDQAKPAKEAAGPAAEAKAAKPKAKAKTDDAYRPPAPDANANPFTGQSEPASKK